MRRFVLAVVFCGISVISSAQEFNVKRFCVAAPAHYHVRIRDAGWVTNAKNLSRYTWPLFRGEPLPEFEKWRKEWLQDKQSDFLVPGLDSLWLDSAQWQRSDFVIELVFGQDGNVFTVFFEMDESIYKRLPENWLRNTFNRLMGGKINAIKFWDFSRTGKKGIGRIYFSLLDLKTDSIPPQYCLSPPSKEDSLRNTPYWRAFSTEGVVVKFGSGRYKVTFCENGERMELRNTRNRDKTLGFRQKYFPAPSSISDSIHKIVYELLSPTERGRIVGEKMEDVLWVVLRLNKKLGVREVVFQIPAYGLSWMELPPERYYAIEKEIKKRGQVTEYYFRKYGKDIVDQDVWVDVRPGKLCKTL